MTERVPKAERKRSRVIRWSVMGAILALVTVASVLHQKLGVGKPVGVDALCPFGGLETLGSLLADGTLVKRVAVSTVLMLGVTLVTALVFRRAFCGRICPLGFLQELFGKLGQKLFGRRLEVPAGIDKIARYFKYVVLAALVYLSWTTASLWVRPYDPWVAYNHLSSAEVFAEFGIGLGVLVVALIGSLLYDRAFCKYACPTGAFLGLMSRVSLFKLRRNESSCIDCKACDKACPVNLTVSTIDTMKSAECIDCGECVAACPVKDTLGISAPASKKLLSPLQGGVFALALFAILVAGATASGQFDWTTKTLSDQIAAEANGEKPLFGHAAGEGGEESGKAEESSESASEDNQWADSAAGFDLTLIKGSTTLAEVIDASGISGAIFTKVYGVPSNEYSKQLKELKDAYGCSPGEVRTFIDAYAADPGVVDSWTIEEHTEG